MNLELAISIHTIQKRLKDYSNIIYDAYLDALPNILLCRRTKTCSNEIVANDATFFLREIIMQALMILTLLVALPRVLILGFLPSVLDR